MDREQIMYILALGVWPAIVGGAVFTAVGAIAFFFDQGEFLW